MIFAYRIWDFNITRSQDVWGVGWKTLEWLNVNNDTECLIDHTIDFFFCLHSCVYSYTFIQAGGGLIKLGKNYFTYPKKNTYHVHLLGLQIFLYI